MAASDTHGPRPEFLTVLGLIPPITLDDVKQAYLEKAKTAHPDHGGNPEDFVRLQRAFEEASEYARFKASRMQWLSRWVEQYAEQQALTEEIHKLGGEVEVEAADSLAASIGNDFANVLDRLVRIRLSGPKIDDRTMLRLAENRRLLMALQRLALIDTQVTGIGLRQLHGFDALRHLDLTGTQLSRQTVKDLLDSLPRLETIVLANTGISWPARMMLRRKGLSVQ